MPAQIIEDDSIGQALGMLYKGFAAGSDPKRKAEALALQSIINQRGAATQQTEIENINLMRQRQGQNEAIKAIGADLESGRAKLPPTITAPAPDAEFVGPMPQVANPRIAEFDQRLATARSIANNAILRGGSATDAATAAWKSLGLGQVYTQGLPTNEPGARELQTIIGGDIPRADVPLTEQQRLVMATEKANQEAALKQMETEAAMARERVQQQGLNQRQLGADLVAPENSTPILTPERRKALNLPDTGPIPVQRSAGKGEIVETPGRPTLRGYDVPDPSLPAPPKPLFEGTGEGAQAWNILDRIVRKHRSGQMLDDNDIQQYFIAKSVAFPEKSEPRIVNGQTQYVPIKTPMPRYLAIPGLVDESELAQGVMARPDTVSAPVPVPAAEGEIPGETPAPVPAPVGVPTMRKPTGKAGEIIEPTKQEYTETAGKNVKYVSQMVVGDTALDDLERAGGMPSMPAGILSDLFAPKLGRYSRDLVRTEAVKNFESAALAFLEPLIRERSGAAVLDSEYSKYHDQFIPMPLDPPALRAWKANSRKEAAKVMREVAEGAPAREILERVQERVGSSPPIASPATPSAPAATPVKPLPEGVTPERVRVNATEEKAKVDVIPGIDAAEKQRRKAAIDARANDYLKQLGVK